VDLKSKKNGWGGQNQYYLKKPPKPGKFEPKSHSFLKMVWGHLEKLILIQKRFGLSFNSLR
jgi:hypothetical protein